MIDNDSNEQIYDVINNVQVLEEHYLKIQFSKYFFTWGLMFIIYSMISVIPYIISIPPFILNFYFIIFIIISIFPANETKLIFRSFKNYKLFKVKILKKTFKINNTLFWIIFYSLMYAIIYIGFLISNFIKFEYPIIIGFSGFYFALLFIDYILARSLTVSYGKIPLEGYVSVISYSIAIIVSIISIVHFFNNSTLFGKLIFITWTTTGILWIIAGAVSAHTAGGLQNGQPDE